MSGPFPLSWGWYDLTRAAAAPHGEFARGVASELDPLFGLNEREPEMFEALNQVCSENRFNKDERWRLASTCCCRPFGRRRSGNSMTATYREREAQRFEGGVLALLRDMVEEGVRVKGYWYARD